MNTPPPWEAAIRARLRAARLQRGLSQKTLGRNVGMAHTVISQFETGARAPGIHSLLRLATALDVSLDYLTGRTDDRVAHLSAGGYLHQRGLSDPDLDLLEVLAGRLAVGKGGGRA